MLLTNQSYINRTLGKQHSGVRNHLAQFRPEVMYNRFFLDDPTNTFSNQRDSFPTGTQPPYSYVLGPKGALVSSSTGIVGASTLSGSFSLGKTMTANLSGTGDVTAAVSITSSMAATIAGTGAVSASITATLGLAATLAGQGDLSGSLALLIPLAANLSGVGAIAANLKGDLDMNATIYVNQSEATVEQLVAGVWGASAALYNDSGTMGQKLNAAGTAGDPWTADLSLYASGTAGKKLKDGLTLGQFIGLK
jgi:hypothetical protein